MTMANHERTKRCTNSQQHKSILFVFFIIAVLDKDRSIVIEHGLRLFERNSMLASIGSAPAPAGIPLESKFLHRQNVATM
jgi:hypothetical protein